ncbi:MAG: CRTAC1 family protein [Microthrixaceae bacterium]
MEALGRTATAVCLAAIVTATAVAGCTDSDPEPQASAGDGPLDALDIPEPPANDPADIPTVLEPGDPALGGLTFTEVSQQAGLVDTQSDATVTGDDSMNSGVAVADIDSDGDYDIFLPRVGKPNGLYLNDGSGQFTDVAQQAGVAGPRERFGSVAGVFSDFDGDGYVDLFAVGAGFGPNELFMNNGDGTFREEAAARGLDWPPRQTGTGISVVQSAAVADVNRDGWMDLLVLDWRDSLVHGFPADDAVAEVTGATEGPTFLGLPTCARATILESAGFPVDDGEPRSKLFINDGQGNFEDRTEEMGLPLGEIVAFTGTFSDLDGDGWQDLTVTGDFCTSRVFRNVDGERFEDTTDQSGTGDDENGMGSVIRDVNGDGTPDWFVTSISYPTADNRCVEERLSEVGCSGNRLYLNDGAGQFVDATDRYGVRDGGWGWGAAIEDFDNDGELEFTMANGYLPPPELASGTFPAFLTDVYSSFVEDGTRFWVRTGEKYHDAAAAVGIGDSSVGHGLVPFDMDGDGDLDLLISPVGSTPVLYRNDSTEIGTWISIGLDDPGAPGNRSGDGARIEVTTAEGTDPVVGWIGTSGSYQSQKPPTVHVGLGLHTEPIESVKIYWPETDEPQVLSDVGLNQRLTVTRAG